MKPLHRALLIAAACLATSAGAISAEDGPKWSPVSQAADLTVYERARKDSDLREFKAVGIIAMPPEVVRRVLDDVDEYPRFMPYVTESRVLSRDGNSRVSYQRVSPPIVGDRDYTIRVRFETRRMAGGGACFCNRWQTANDLGPAAKAGVVRVKVTEGSWLLEPTTDGRQTRATYCIFSDSGGSLPPYIANAASKTAIPKLFAAVRKQAELEKYSAAR
ncbi:MAG: START domain-containing protein [Chthoniobacteraceae bacterium]